MTSTPATGELVRGSIDERRLMARSLAYLWASGTSLLLLTLLLPHGRNVDDGALAAIAAVAYVAAGLMFGVRSLPRWAFELFLALGTVMIGTTVVLSGSATSGYALYYVWLTVHAFYFLPWTRAAPQLAFMVVAYAGALLLSPSSGDTRAVRYAMVVGTLVVTAAFVGLLKARVDRLVRDLSDAARRDFLTGLLNRRGFEESFEDELERVSRGDRSLSVLFADIDHFKALNDRLGHGAGDETLRRLARVLDGAGRRIDTTARIGGEEFAMLLPDTDARGAFVLAERLCAAVRTATRDGAARVTVSVGLATYPEDGRDAESLSRSADQALYAAKRLGRDRVVIFSPDLTMVLDQAERRRAEDASIQLAAAVALADALDLRLDGAAHHSRAVARYAELTALQLGLPPDRVERIRLAAAVHDIGKVGISDSILHKPGPLTDEEWEQMRKHPEIGARLLPGDDVGDIRSWVLAHHERPDGRGYPLGLTPVPLEAGILAVADAFEAMTTDRVYRPALGVEAACDELERGAGTQFDPRAARALVNAVRHDHVELPTSGL